MIISNRYEHDFDIVLVPCWHPMVIIEWDTWIRYNDSVIAGYTDYNKRDKRV